MKPKRRLLISIALLAILCLVVFGLALSYPRYKDYRLQRQIAAVDAQLRALGNALEVYYVEFEAYPPPMAADGRPAGRGPGQPAVGVVPSLLTTPVRYLAADVPLTDPFTPEPYQGIQYAVAPGMCWILSSVGIDTHDDVQDFGYVNRREFYRCQERDFFSPWGGGNVVYDPSNGLLSQGDMVELGP